MPKTKKKIRLRTGRFYKLEVKGECADYDMLVSVDRSVSNGYLLEKVTKDFMYTDEFLVLGEEDISYAHEIFKPKPILDNDKLLFDLAFRVATSEEFNEDLGPMEISAIRTYEFDHGLFTKFWKLDRDDEKAWLEKMNMFSAGDNNRFVSSDQWFEDSEYVMGALHRVQSFKKILVELVK